MLTKYKGFTLIELLVVVAIIAVLMSILLPSLGSARRQAKTVACAANVRSIGQATMAYAAEYDNWLVPSGMQVANGVAFPGGMINNSGRTIELSWDDLLDPYMLNGLTQAEKEAFQIPINRKAEFARVLMCPADDYRVDGRGYGWASIGGVGVACRWSASTHVEPKRLSMIADPSMTIGLSENPEVWNPVLGYYQISNKSGSTSGAHLDYPHHQGTYQPTDGVYVFTKALHSKTGGAEVGIDDRFNYLFMDMHVELLNRQKTVGRTRNNYDVRLGNASGYLQYGNWAYSVERK